MKAVIRVNLEAGIKRMKKLVGGLSVKQNWRVERDERFFVWIFQAVFL